MDGLATNHPGGVYQMRVDFLLCGSTGSLFSE
jgi:hypothetical protein